MPPNGLILFQTEISNFHLKGPRFFKLNHCETFSISYSNARLPCAQCPIYGQQLAREAVGDLSCSLLRGKYTCSFSI